jgi:hypothetical protein
MDKHCKFCFGLGWVCENHPEKAWDDELGCTCGAGMPCHCNDSDPPDTSRVIFDEEENPTRH